MEQNRASGILLHPTSLPGPDGIGDLGPEAYRWIDFLSRTGCQFWQVLPLGPTGYGDSPYQCFSAFAGNPYLISATTLLDQDLLTKSDLADRPGFSIEKVEYGRVIEWKLKLLRRSYQHIQLIPQNDVYEEFEAFKSTEAEWLRPFATFMAIKAQHKFVAWKEWPEVLRKREPKAIRAFKKKHMQEIDFQAYLQFLFFRQWQSLKEYAAKKGIRIIGDIPIFVAYDSADVWVNKDLFYLDEEGLPEVVAGVPPDYFSKTGQLWGNPLYKWAVHKNNGYSWWLKRIQAVLQRVDIVRLDHFRGFEAYWEIPFGNETAVEGRWVKGPGEDFFKVVKEKLGELPIIAEDLGVITEGVVKMREAFNLPGMKILQFAFASDTDDDFLPHNFNVNCVAYTGTHDNNTTRGWFDKAPGREKDLCRRYLARSGQDIAWSMIRALWRSVAAWVVAPMQDFLTLGEWARMNYPGIPSGNWGWRMLPDAIDQGLVSRLHETNYLYGRLPAREKTTIHQALIEEMEGQVMPH
ncbi:MAG: 4-alpha-glucanotransferase [Chloroflexota bacterium]|nr:4-alpha-glucanotransferase [Chloroflexota bacterium]